MSTCGQAAANESAGDEIPEVVLVLGLANVSHGDDLYLSLLRSSFPNRSEVHAEAAESEQFRSFRHALASAADYPLPSFDGFPVMLIYVLLLLRLRDLNLPTLVCHDDETTSESPQADAG